ncbi:hypothetical protein [Actinophytocola oryzae]|uniref:Uncharacterized protein n=1 Tax=Actinophytocola oryzae TaxID=502181 RepID=A0A4R7USC2_9PSEU|nr:hypothetical protein [Actinophytocola oryzae]TDV38634.1 hypothetical protein CLV71_12619 [Actinophytocola oryzae]
MVISGLFAIRNRRTPRPTLEIESRYRVPRKGSAAYQPMTDLAEAEEVLAELLGRLSERPGASPVVDRLRRAAAETASAVRSTAVRLMDAERARHEVDDLRVTLDEGLDTYRGHIATVGRVMLLGIDDLRVNGS